MSIASICIFFLACTVIWAAQRWHGVHAATNGTLARVTLYQSKFSCDTVVDSVSLPTYPDFSTMSPCIVVHREPAPSSTVYAYQVICNSADGSSGWTVAMRRFSCTTPTCTCSGPYYYKAAVGTTCQTLPQPWDMAYTVDCSNGAVPNNNGVGGGGGGDADSSTAMSAAYGGIHFTTTSALSAVSWSLFIATCVRHFVE